MCVFTLFCVPRPFAKVSGLNFALKFYRVSVDFPSKFRVIYDGFLLIFDGVCMDFAWVETAAGKLVLFDGFRLILNSVWVSQGCSRQLVTCATWQLERRAGQRGSAQLSAFRSAQRSSADYIQPSPAQLSSVQRSFPSAQLSSAQLS